MCTILVFCDKKSINFWTKSKIVGESVKCMTVIFFYLLLASQVAPALHNMRQVQLETLPKNSNFSSFLQNICYLKLYSWKLWISCSRWSQWMRMHSGKWLKIRCYSLWVRDFLFHCFIFIWKKHRLEVYCSVFLLFSRCIDHFICYSRIVYIGDSLGHMTNHTLVADYLN